MFFVIVELLILLFCVFLLDCLVFMKSFWNLVKYVDLIDNGLRIGFFCYLILWKIL